MFNNQILRILTKVQPVQKFTANAKIRGKRQNSWLSWIPWICDFHL